MERIDKKYAVIYIDWDGEALNTENNHFCTDEMVTDYYNQAGPIQWNIYCIFPKEIAEAKADDILNDEHYMRKFVIPKDEIKAFVNEMFPDMNPETGHGMIDIIKGENHIDCIKKTIEAKKSYPYTDIYRSWYRDISSLDTLSRMDELRAEMIRNSNIFGLFATHIGDEHFWARKKFAYFNQIELEKLNKKQENGENIPPNTS